MNRSQSVRKPPLRLKLQTLQLQSGFAFMCSRSRRCATFRQPVQRPLCRGFILSVVTLSLLTVVVNRAGGIDVDTVFQTDPPFPEVEVVVRPWPKRQEIWLLALARPEVELQVRAADAIARAHQGGVPGMKKTVPNLMTALTADDAHPLLRLAAARTLIVLDARESAEVLMNLVRREGAPQTELAELVEPGLTAWNYTPMHAVWLERLRTQRFGGRMLVLAIRAAASTQLTESVPELLELVQNREAPPHVRLESARALVTIQSAGHESAARQILSRAASNARIESLLAAILLSRHSSPDVLPLLQELADHPEPAVVAIALQRLLEIAPVLVEPMNSRIAVHSDTNVRKLAVRILQEQGTVSAVKLLGGMLDDVHPTVRKMAQGSLVLLDQLAELRPVVREVAMQMLTSGRRRAMEQAAIVIGGVDHEPASERLIELLDSDHPFVAVAAAWALRRLLVPATAEPILEKVRMQTKEFPHAPPNPDWNEKKVAALYQQRGHLIEALALMRHRDVVPLLLACLPTPPAPPGAYREAQELRVQAIWALGHIFRDDPQPEIVARLTERLQTPDDTAARGKTLIQPMAAVSLARIGAVETLDLLRGLYAPGDKYSDLRYGCAWGVSWMTNEPLPEFDMVRTTGHFTSFLDPLDE